MSDKLEQTMKKIHIYLANCKPSAYSSEDLIVSKTRLFALLDELNYAVYEAMEEYEVTVAARDRGIALAERQAADIKEEALRRADQIHASSLLYTQEAITDVKTIMEDIYEKIRIEYEMMLMNYEEKMHYLEQDSMEIVSQLQSKAEAKTYLRMVEDIRANRKNAMAVTHDEVSASRKIGSAAASADAFDSPADEYEDKLSSAIVVEVHDTPKIPEGFGRGKKKKKKGKGSGSSAGQVTAQELDAEYFAFQEEQQKALEEQIADELSDAPADEEEVESIFGALKKLTFGKRR